MAATKHNNWVKVDSAGHQLRGDAAASYLRMIKAGMALGGTQVFRRTFEAQGALRRAYEQGRGPVAARPSWGAPHIQGIAVDNRTTGAGGKYSPSGTHAWMSKGGSGGQKPKAGEKLRCHDYGWRRTVPSERWHFGYNPALDKKASADLKARLKALGYTTVKDFQKANGLTGDGKAGPSTWAKLLTNPKKNPAVKPPPPVYSDFRFGQANLKAERFGGLDDDSPKRGQYLEDKLNCSLYALCEVSEDARNATRKAMPGGSKVWLTYAVNYLCVMWDSTKWDHYTTIKKVTFNKLGVHGAIRVTLKSPTTGLTMDVISIFVRPGDALTGSDAEKLKQKQADIKKAVAELYRYGCATVIAGDFQTGTAEDVLLPLGWVRGTPNVDTMPGKPDAQRLDAVFFKPGTSTKTAMLTREFSQVKAGSVSDHTSWIWNGRVGTAPDTT